MNSPEGIAISSVGVLFVADTGNNRILKFITGNAPTYGAKADAVIGQSGFDKNAVPTTASPTNLYSPQNLALEVVPDSVQKKGGLSLWVADRLQNRILRYDGTSTDFSANLAATLVLGQADLSGSDYGTDQYSVMHPYGVAIDTTASDTSSPRTVWIADTQNNRVLRFNPHEPLIPTKPPARIALPRRRRRQLQDQERHHHHPRQRLRRSRHRLRHLQRPQRRLQAHPRRSRVVIQGPSQGRQEPLHRHRLRHPRPSLARQDHHRQAHPLMETI